MIFLMDPEFWARLFGIVIIDLTLAGDNALVIALAVRTLPQRQQFWGRVWGAAGAGGVPLGVPAPPPALLRAPLLPPPPRPRLLWTAAPIRRPRNRAGRGAPHGGS